MSDNWVVQNLENALNTWNEKLAEIWQLITQSPQQFKGGTIWGVIVDIHGALQAIGLALLVLFFVVGVMKTCGSFAEVKRPEHALKLFIRFALAKGAVTYGMELMLALFNIAQGVISTIMQAAGFGTAQQTVLPSEIVTAVETAGSRAVLTDPDLPSGSDRILRALDVIDPEDVDLPGMSGMEAQALLARNPLTAHIPVLAISATASPQVLRKAREAGFIDYVTKPFDIAAFVARVGQILEHRSRND